MFQESRSLGQHQKCDYVHTGAGTKLCNVQLTQAQCATAAQNNCVNGAKGNIVNGKYIWYEGDITALSILVDEQNNQGNKTPNLDFLELPSGCYVLKGKQGGSLYYFYKGSSGTKKELTQGDKNICFGGKIFKTSIATEDSCTVYP